MYWAFPFSTNSLDIQSVLEDFRDFYLKISKLSELHFSLFSSSARQFGLQISPFRLDWLFQRNWALKKFRCCHFHQNVSGGPSDLSNFVQSKWVILGHFWSLCYKKITFTERKWWLQLRLLNWDFESEKTVNTKEDLFDDNTLFYFFVFRFFRLSLRRSVATCICDV